jgi:hypothetical protein
MSGLAGFGVEMYSILPSTIEALISSSSKEEVLELHSLIINKLANGKHASGYSSGRICYQWSRILEWLHKLLQWLYRDPIIIRIGRVCGRERVQRNAGIITP